MRVSQLGRCQSSRQGGAGCGTGITAGHSWAARLEVAPAVQGYSGMAIPHGQCSEPTQSPPGGFVGVTLGVSVLGVPQIPLDIGVQHWTENSWFVKGLFRHW